MNPRSTNFDFLRPQQPLLAQLAALAERYFTDDPVTALIKLRQFGEALAKQVAASANSYASYEESQIDLLHRLKAQDILPPQAADLFHSIRRAGNAATHDNTGNHAQALQHLKLARELALWFHRSFGGARGFKPGPFVPPQPPETADDKLTAELTQLRGELDQARTATERAEAEADEQEQLRMSAEARAKKADEDRAFWESFAEDAETQLANQAEALAATQAQAQQKPAAEIRDQVASAKQADADIDPDEAATRLLIDEQLRLRGWECDTAKLTYPAGTRPHKSRNLAIAEWPTASGPADYALFCGLTCVAIVEAKRLSKDVPAMLQQAKRYSRDFTAHDSATLPKGGPWGDYKVPFMFAANGRPFLQQIKTKSGIWFWDARHKDTPSRALPDWYTPQGLMGLLRQDIDAAHEKLKTEPLDYLDLRYYHHKAIEAVESAIENRRRECLLAMATGTGKTRTAIALVYRLIKSGRFRRILFLVDRTSLGDQAAGAFKNVKLEQLKSFSEIYGVKELADIVPDDDTRLQISTIQGVMRRVLFPSDESAAPTVDQYDCIIIDEAHRGYNLDREMSDAEMTFRSEADYISKYRRVLDYFDAVKIALTATPARHTLEIFGKAVFTYSYRDAVLDGYLVDHEPPYRIVTQLADKGIRFTAGEKVATYNRKTEQLSDIILADDVDIDIDGFNRQVLTENFNKTLCDELAKHIDPGLPGKTLIFCVNRHHADIVVSALKASLADRYGGVDDDAVARITGEIDRPGEMIRRYKNEQLPNIAVTVDLLTTGINVPKIVNLVFIRRVRSPMLYTQMLGRATRLCPEINKEYFRIFDCVDLYSAIQDATDMKPVVQNPKIPFEQLVRELGELKDAKTRAEVFEQLIAKLQAKCRGLRADGLQQFAELADAEPKEIVTRLRDATLDEAASWFAEHRALVAFLDTTRTGESLGIVSDHQDAIKEVVRGYGDSTKPADYLDRFKQYLDEHMNEIPALIVVTQRPRDLTREQLRNIKRVLDQAGYTEARLRTAHRQLSNQDIAASIIGYIRGQALGEALVPYAERVSKAMKTILGMRAWTDVQRRWLDRIGKQLEKEIVVDRAAMDSDSFREHGGFKRLNKVFDNGLEKLLGDINEAVWQKVG